MPSLAPEVAQFSTPAFALRDDLKSLDRVRQAAATEAVIFYCSRALDAVSRSAVERMRLPPSVNVFANLELLEQYGLLTDAMRYWAHGLRRMGNDVRHLLRAVRPTDVEVVLLYFERWLDWYFCRFPLGPRLKSLTTDGSPLELGANVDWRAIVAAIDAACDADTMVGLAESSTIKEISAATPTIPAVIIEGLLDLGQTKLAEQLASTTLDRFTGEMRLQQLQALARSRMWREDPEQLDKARHTLEELRKRYPDDEETVGILAGVYKRLAEREPAGEWLAKSHKSYREGWKRSHRSNAYLGINAATTALWLGDRNACQELAGDVRRVLAQRRELVSRASADFLLSSYWDEVTLAEAELLQTNWQAANDAYALARSRHAKLHGNWDVTRGQAERIIKALDGADPKKVVPALFGA